LEEKVKELEDDIIEIEKFLNYKTRGRYRKEGKRL